MEKTKFVACGTHVKDHLKTDLFWDAVKVLQRNFDINAKEIDRTNNIVVCLRANSPATIDGISNILGMYLKEGKLVKEN